MTLSSTDTIRSADSFSLLTRTALTSAHMSLIRKMGETTHPSNCSVSGKEAPANLSNQPIRWVMSLQSIDIIQLAHLPGVHTERAVN